MIVLQKHGPSCLWKEAASKVTDRAREPERARESQGEPERATESQGEPVRARESRGEPERARDRQTDRQTDRNRERERFSVHLFLRLSMEERKHSLRLLLVLHPLCQTPQPHQHSLLSHLSVMHNSSNIGWNYRLHTTIFI